MKVLRIYNANNDCIASKTVGDRITKEQIEKKIAFLFGDNKFFVYYKLSDK